MDEVDEVDEWMRLAMIYDTNQYYDVICCVV